MPSSLKNDSFHRHKAVSDSHKTITSSRNVSNQTLYVSYLTILFAYNPHFCTELNSHTAY